MIKSQTAKKIANNTIYQIIGKVVSMSITILATMIITRIYGKTGFGEFNLMQNIPALFFIVVDFGINAIATRELSKDFSKAQKYLGNILLLRFLLSIFMMLLLGMMLFIFPYSAGLKFGIYLSLFLILTQALYATTNIIFQVKLRYDYSTIGYVTGSIVILLFVLLFSYLNYDVAWVNFSYVIGGVVTFLINIFLISKFLNLKIKLEFDKSLIKYLLIQSLPLGLMFVFSQINFKADSIMLSLLAVPDFLEISKTEAVAIYGLPYKIFEVLLVVPTFLMNAVYPVLVRHMGQSQQKLKTTFFKTTIFLFGAGLLVGAIGILFSDLAIRILGGTQFSESGQVLRLLLIGIPIFYVSQPISWLIVTLSKQKSLPLIYLIGAIFNFSANLILIPKYSFYVSSVLTFTSEILILILLIVFAHKAWKKTYA